MLRKTAGFFMFIIGCIMVVGISIFLIYYTLIQKQSINNNGFLIYLLYFIFIIFIVVGFCIIDDAEKKEKYTE